MRPSASVARSLQRWSSRSPSSVRLTSWSPVVVSLQLLAASVPLTPGGAGTQQALIAPLSAGTI